MTTRQRRQQVSELKTQAQRCVSSGSFRALCETDPQCEFVKGKCQLALSSVDIVRQMALQFGVDWKPDEPLADVFDRLEMKLEKLVSEMPPEQAEEVEELVQALETVPEDQKALLVEHLVSEAPPPNEKEKGERGRTEELSENQKLLAALIIGGFGLSAWSYFFPGAAIVTLGVLGPIVTAYMLPK